MTSPADDEDEKPEGYLTTLRAGVDAGVLAGFFLGILDGAKAASLTGFEGPWNLLGCLATSVLIYSLSMVALTLAASPLTHLLFGKQPVERRIASHLTLTLGAAIFLVLYWFLRPRVFSGLSATDPKRVASALAMLVAGLLLGLAGSRLWRRLPNVVGSVISFVAIGLCAMGLLFLGQQGERDVRGKMSDRNRDLPNVVLFVVDALRADYIGAYGDETTRTPTFDAIAEEGVLFENAFVQAPFTWTSFGSILTGKYPRRHGLVKMEAGVRMRPNVTLPFHLKTALRKTDGARLEPDDWYGATFMTGTLSHGTGLMRGFDVYLEALVGHELVDLSSPWSVFRSELLFYKTRNKILQRFDRELVATSAAEWIAKWANRRFVVMVHLYSTHTPYDSPPEYRDLYVDPSYDGPIDAFFASSRKAIESGQYEPTEADETRIEDLYQAGVTMADAMIGTVVEELRAQGILDNTLVIATSDHGEELGDHGVWEHNFMYQTNLRVPLVMRLPRKLPGGTRIDAPVDSIDILPTVCDLLGLEVPDDPEEPDERGRVDGVSLLPLIAGDVSSIRPYSFSENGRFLSIQSRESKLIVATETMAEGGFERAVTGDPEPSRFYDLSVDPDERMNVFADRLDDARALFDILIEWDRSMPIARMRKSDLDLGRIRETLEGLGYTDGIGGEGEIEEDGGP